MQRTATVEGAAPAAPSRPLLRSVSGGLGIVPFALYTGVFLGLPTLFIVVGAFQDREGGFALTGIERLFAPLTLQILWNSVWISALTAIVGGIAGAIVAYVLSTAPAGSALRRVTVALCSVLAQFGGVMLAFAFIATLGQHGLVTRALAGLGVGVDPAMLSTLAGVAVVYLYFQLPLMVVVFLPAVEGLRPQWREAVASLGGSNRQYWTSVALPLLAPSFLGAVLLLFANAFSAFATAAALISQQRVILPMEIESAIRNENTPGLESYSQALALLMMLVVALVMTLYARLQRRASRWLS